MDATHNETIFLVENCWGQGTYAREFYNDLLRLTVSKSNIMMVGFPEVTVKGLKHSLGVSRHQR